MFIKELILDNVQIDDQSLTQMLKSLVSQKSLDSLTLCQLKLKGSFSKVLDVIMGPIMKRGLLDLALIDVPASIRDMQRLLGGDVRNEKTMPGLGKTGQANRLRSLKLSKLSLNDNLIVKMLCVLISDEDPDEVDE